MPILPLAERRQSIVDERRVATSGGRNAASARFALQCITLAAQRDARFAVTDPVGALMAASVAEAGGNGGDRPPPSVCVLTSLSVGKNEKTIRQVLSGRSDANIRFEALRTLLLALGFAERTRGSHHTFAREGVEEQINLQRDGAKAKPYQVKQVRVILLRYRLQEV